MNGLSFRDFLKLPCLLSLARIPLGITMLVLWHLDFSKLVIMQPGILGAITDFLDGYIARKTKQCSKTGELLDPLCDKFLIACAGIIIINEVEFWPALITIVFEIIFIVTPIIGALKTDESVASMWPGKVRINIQCLAILSFYLGYISLGNNFLFAAMPFSVLTCVFGVQKILDGFNNGK